MQTMYLIYDASSSALKKALVSDLLQTSEEIQDLIGAMFSSNTETGIAATYQDGDGTIDLVIGDDTIVSSMLDTNIAIAGTLGVTGKITADAGIDIDNFNIDGTTIALSSGDMLLDAAGDIILDADDGDIILKDGGTTFGQFSISSGDLFIQQPTADKDIVFRGLDGSSYISALTLDMSNAGEATFNADLVIPSSIRHAGDADTKLDFNQANTMRLITGDVTAWICNASSMIVNEDSVDFDFRVESNDHTHMFFVDGGTNRVGINNPSSATAPVFPFVVWDDDEVTVLGHGNNATYIQRYQTHATAPATLVMDKARGTQASPTTSANGDDIGRILFRGYTDNGYNEVASIHAEVHDAGIGSGADIPGDLYFKTTADGGTAKERMRLNADGLWRGELLNNSNVNPTGENSGKLWSTSGNWINVWYVGNDATGAHYWIELDIQSLDGYTSYGEIYKDRNGRWRIVQHRQAGTNFQVAANNNYIQVTQGSGANQVNSSGNLKLVRIPGANA